jgi:hypothetical protein
VALGFLIHQSERPGAPALVFLHGWREGFVDDAASPKAIWGLRNLRKHGPPQLLDDPHGALERNHPLFGCSLVAPQLPNDDQRWSLEHAAEVRSVLEALLPSRPVYVMGFSMGGKGAVDIGPALGARALLLIDPSSMDDAAFAQSLERCTLPTWSLYARHEDERLKRNITQIQDELQSFELHLPGLEARPETGGKWRSAITPRTLGNLHTAICADATRSPVPYDWLLGH